MTVTRSVADALSEHAVFEVECIDRMFCNVYVPGSQYAPGLVACAHRQLGLPIASTAPLARIAEAFDKAVHRGKQLIDKPGRTRRYHVPPAAARTIAALLTLRDRNTASRLMIRRMPVTPHRQRIVES